VLLTLSVLSLAASVLYFSHTEGPPVHGGVVPALVQQSTAKFESPFDVEPEPGKAGAEHAPAMQESGAAPASFVPTAIAAESGVGARAGTIFGQSPHEILFYLSGAVGFAGIFIAFVLHYVGRRTAATSLADALLPSLGPIPRWAQHKWYVDEFYNLAIRTPLLVVAHLCNLFDKLIVDGLVRLFGAIPRLIGNLIRPTQSGILHDYAAGMVAGVAVLLFIVFMLTLR
jgi:NADH-quinone oxidoreductase subunit L